MQSSFHTTWHCPRSASLISRHVRAPANFMKSMNFCILCCIMSFFAVRFWFTRFFPPLFSPPLLSSGHFSFHSFSIIFCNSLALWIFLLISSLAVNPVLYIISNIIFITSISALICPSLRLASYSQITISRGEECVLQDNSQRTKWKVISPTGNEAMVPSVCFTVPPPNQEAIDTASRWATYWKRALVLRMY